MDTSFWFHYQNHVCVPRERTRGSEQEVSMPTVLRDTTKQIFNSYHAIVTVSWSAPSVIGHQISEKKKAAAC